MIEGDESGAHFSTRDAGGRWRRFSGELRAPSFRADAARCRHSGAHESAARRPHLRGASTQGSAVYSGRSRDPLAQTSSARAPETFEPRTNAEWEALVGGMLEWQVERRTGEQLSAAQRDRLVSELARLREASLALQEAPAEPGDPAELRERLARTLTLAQVDEAFRDELGVGVSEFLRDMDPDAVEDVSRLPNRRIALVLALSMWTQHATSSSRIAAHINDEEIPTAAVDAMSIEQVQRIRSRLMETTHQALEDLIDQRLGIDEHAGSVALAERRRDLSRAQREAQVASARSAGEPASA